MTRRSSIRNLQLIVALDSINYGLLYRYNGLYYRKLGGALLTEGFFTSALFLTELSSPEIASAFVSRYGKRSTLSIILVISFITHVIMMTERFWFWVLARLAFMCIHQTNQVCYALLNEKEHNESNRPRLHTNYNFLSNCGFLLGPIIGAHLLQNNFTHVWLLSSSIILMSILTLRGVDPPEGDEESRNPPRRSGWKDYLQRLTQYDWSEIWDLLLVKYCFNISMWVLLTKFQLLLQHRHGVRSLTVVGWSIAYMNCIIFLTSCYTGDIKEVLYQYPSVVPFYETAFLVIAVLSVFMCQAPTISIFLVIIVPILFVQTIVMSMWTDFFGDTVGDDLEGPSRVVQVVAGLSGHFWFNLSNHLLGPSSVPVFACGPLIVCWLIVRFHSRTFQVGYNGDDEQ